MFNQLSHCQVHSFEVTLRLCHTGCLSTCLESTSVNMTAHPKIWTWYSGTRSSTGTSLHTTCASGQAFDSQSSALIVNMVVQGLWWLKEELHVCSIAPVLRMTNRIVPVLWHKVWMWPNKFVWAWLYWPQLAWAVPSEVQHFVQLPGLNLQQLVHHQSKQKNK